MPIAASTVAERGGGPKVGRVATPAPSGRMAAHHLQPPSTMSTTTAPGSVRRLAIGDLEQELATTRRVLERVPDEHWDWKPHAKSFNLGHLATHLATLPHWSIAILSGDEFDIATAPPRDLSTTPRDRAAVLALLDQNLAAMRAALEGLDDDALLKPWTLRRGEHVVFTLPRVAAFRTMIISHQIHHRGQMTVYLRLLDVAVPGVYGPSADEPF